MERGNRGEETEKKREEEAKFRRNLGFSHFVGTHYIEYSLHRVVLL